MTFAQLLQNLGSYLDFSKRMATTVPGLVMALAIVLLSGSVPDWAVRPFACGETLQAERRAAAADSRLQAFDGSWKGADDNIDTRFFLRASERTLKREYGEALAAASACQKNCADKLAAVDRALKNLRAFEASDNGKAWQTYEKAIAAAAKNEEAAREAVADEGTLAKADWDFARNLGTNRCDASTATWTQIANQLLLFGLLGFAFGVVFDPINKALFLQIFPDTVAGAAYKATKRLPRLMAASMVWSVGLLVPAEAIEHATRRRQKLAADHDPLVGHTPQFFIGRGIITDGEYQDLVDRYYRFSELTIGLVLPLVLIGVAVFLHERALGYDVSGAVWGVVAIGGAIVVARVGVRRHVEFTRAVSELISGRLATLDQQEQTARASVDLTQLHQLVDRAGEIMAMWFRRS